VVDNLFQALNESTRKAFEQGSGSELQDTASRPAKIKALHSSSALAVNFFDRWVINDAAVERGSPKAIRTTFVGFQKYL
jgi:hypothetical protein